MVLGRDRKIDQHDGIAVSLMSTPCTIGREFLKVGGNIGRIATQIKLQAFQDSCDNIADIGSDNIGAGRSYSLSPLIHVDRSKRFPVLSENVQAGLSLVDFLSAT